MTLRNKYCVQYWRIAVLYYLHIQEGGSMTQTITLWNETGGVGKTTSAVSLAMLGAIRGLNTILVDLDPRAASTKWIGAVPEDEGMHVGAILADTPPGGSGERLPLPPRRQDNLLIR